jgi:hypothetical protein
MTVAQSSVGSRRVYIVRGTRTQTINICDADNRRGDYDWIVRIVEPPFVTPQEIGAFADIEELIRWLQHERKGLIEQSPTVDVATEITPVPLDTGYLPQRDPWIEKAKPLVDSSIDALVQQFLEFPYLHRVEHSLHAELFNILMAQRHFSQQFQLANSEYTQTIHKEWPETIPRAARKRGNFDLAVVSPQQLKRCTLAESREGRIAAPIVIEVGLDYDLAHLAGDEEKLLNSCVPYGYLIHLEREKGGNAGVEKIINQPKGDGSIRTAYGRVAGPSKFRKLIADDRIVDLVELVT